MPSFDRYWRQMIGTYIDWLLPARNGIFSWDLLLCSPRQECQSVRVSVSKTGTPRFGNGRVLPSWIQIKGIRGLRTDLGKILSIWPFENLTTVFLVHKVKSKTWEDNKKISQKQKRFLIPPLHNKIFVWIYQTKFLEGSIFCTVHSGVVPSKSVGMGKKIDEIIFWIPC